MRVAPHAGAWIEIVRDNVGNKAKLVAPHAGAWIEMRLLCLLPDGQRSHPTRVRGLKYNGCDPRKIIPTSHPTRVRGLKS